MGPPLAMGMDRGRRDLRRDRHRSHRVDDGAMGRLSGSGGVDSPEQRPPAHRARGEPPMTAQNTPLFAAQDREPTGPMRGPWARGAKVAPRTIASRA